MIKNIQIFVISLIIALFLCVACYIFFIDYYMDLRINSFINGSFSKYYFVNQIPNIFFIIFLIASVIISKKYLNNYFLKENQFL